MANTRTLAVKALMRVNEGGFSNIVLDALLSGAQLEHRDRAFVSALFYGVLERRITLDKVIKRYSSKPLERLEPAVLECLRIGFYQLIYMNSVPDMAALNETVEAVKQLGFAKASGFVNGIMRSFVRDGKKFDFSRLDKIGRLSAEYSAPIWLCKKWCNEYGEEKTETALRESLGSVPIFARVNTTKTNEEELMSILAEENVKSVLMEEIPDALQVYSVAPQSTKAYKNGLFHVQDISSQLCARAVGAQKGERVLDVCSAPGGKTFTVAQLMENDGEIVACDLHPKRAGLVKNGAERLGLSIVTAKANDATVFNEKLGTFDRILCDVPCSGLGVIRRKPEIRFKDPAEISALPKIQYKIASTSAGYLKEGGTMVYSTCTLSKEENEQVVKRLMEEDGLLPCELPEELKKYSRDGFSVTLMPGEINSDGFYFAKLRKEVK
ncbi:MAG: 16S rRNA (cytosine(967)-C(5))-methyltransferase RsmB [Oscillospiraceae bacterium]|nr:16S rRNA (cytosine(967)-C(5))-methyltransferase RsmB [Oscillospiraceae bacterium]